MTTPKRRRVAGGLYPPGVADPDPSAEQVVRLQLPPALTTVRITSKCPGGLREAWTNPSIAIVLLHGQHAENEADAVGRWLRPDVEPLLMDGGAMTAPVQSRRLWRLSGLANPGNLAPTLPVLIETPPLLVAALVEQLDAVRRGHTWSKSLLAVVCCTNVYEGYENRRLRRHALVRVCYMPELDVARHYSAVAHELGVDSVTAARLRDPALANAAGSVVALRSFLRFYARGDKQVTAVGARDHTIERLDAAAGHVLGYHAGAPPDPTYIHAVAPECCALRRAWPVEKALEQLSTICDDLATLDLLRTPATDSVQALLVSAVTGRHRPTPPPRQERRRLSALFYKHLQKRQMPQLVWRDQEDLARGALGRTLSHPRLGGVPPIPAAVCLGAVGFATAPCDLELLSRVRWPVVAAANSVTAALHAARAGTEYAFAGTAWALAWTQLATLVPKIASVALRRAVETAHALSGALRPTVLALYDPQAAVEDAAASLLSDYRVVMYK